MLQRGEFASSDAGKMAKALIESAVCCVGCGKLAVRTLDFDVLGDLEQLPVCQECLNNVKADVGGDLRRSGRDPSATFSVNGWGRV